MVDRVQQTRQVNSDGTASARTTEVVDKSDTVDSKDSIASRIIWFIGGVIAVLLAFRFVFILLGASTVSGFANFIYSASHPFASPFFWALQLSATVWEAKFELSTLVAIVVYLLVAYGIAKLLTIRQPR